MPILHEEDRTWLGDIRHRIIQPFRWRLKHLKVVALVGPTGSGKSFRARLIMEKRNIQFLIDDGLLISGHQILAGKSAKREANRFKAVKRAIFDDPDHAREVRKTLKNQRLQSILILGTSEKMIAHISEKLELPFPDEIIYIEDVATAEEIAMANQHRRQHGKHVIPVPVVEVIKDPSHHVLDSIRFFLENKSPLFWKKKVVEKTIVQPPFSRRGNLSISETALRQMVMHCIAEYDKGISVRRIMIEPVRNGIIVELRLCVPFGLHISESLGELHEYMIGHIERYSGIHIEKLHLTVDHVQQPESNE